MPTIPPLQAVGSSLYIYIYIHNHAPFYGMVRVGLQNSWAGILQNTTAIYTSLGLEFRA